MEVDAEVVEEKEEDEEEKEKKEEENNCDKNQQPSPGRWTIPSNNQIQQFHLIADER